MNNIYGYIRVSTISQREDRQWAALEEFGLPHENVFVDKQSGKDFDRPAYNELMARLAAARARGVKLGRKLMKKPRGYEAVRARWAAKEISARKAAKILGVSCPTFLKWVKEQAHS